MPSHYGDKTKKTGMAKMTKQQHEKFKKAVKDGKITEKQHNSLPVHLLEAIVKSKSKAKKKK